MLSPLISLTKPYEDNYAFQVLHTAQTLCGSQQGIKVYFQDSKGQVDEGFVWEFPRTLDAYLRLDVGGPGVLACDPKAVTQWEIIVN